MPWQTFLSICYSCQGQLDCRSNLWIKNNILLTRGQDHFGIKTICLQRPPQILPSKSTMSIACISLTYIYLTLILQTAHWQALEGQYDGVLWWYMMEETGQSTQRKPPTLHGWPLSCHITTPGIESGQRRWWVKDLSLHYADPYLLVETLSE